MLTVPLLPRPSDVLHPVLVSGWQTVARVRWFAAVLHVRRARERVCALPQLIRLNITNKNSSLKTFFFKYSPSYQQKKIIIKKNKDICFGIYSVHCIVCIYPHFHHQHHTKTHIFAFACFFKPTFPPAL